jgi:hypothetical protein
MSPARAAALGTRTVQNVALAVKPYRTNQAIGHTKIGPMTIMKTETARSARVSAFIPVCTKAYSAPLDRAYSLPPPAI